MLDLSLLRKGKAELRDYQIRAAEKLFDSKRLLVVMPTALGKTFVAILAIAHLLKNNPKKILFLAPTKPLVLQQAKRLEESVDTLEEIAVVTGEVKPEERKEKYKTATVIFATPQTIANDLKHERIALKDFALVVFDEAHRSVGNYAYALIGKKTRESGALVLGLTASPSADKKKTMEICENLGIEAVDIKTSHDEEVQEFIKPVEFHWIFVEMPRELLVLKEKLELLLAEPVKRISERGFMSFKQSPSRKELLMLRLRFLGLAKQNPSFYSLLSDIAKALNVAHAIDMLESQGVRPLMEFIDSLGKRDKKTKAVQSLLADARLKEIRKNCEMLLEKNIEHPKEGKLAEIIRAQTKLGKSVIVFAQYRDTVAQLARVANSLPGVKAKTLVGRSDDGMNQKEQHEVVESFRDKEFNVLIATSIGEEGLDIPAVDMVVFYEAVPSEIRLIQRRGRAGRMKIGSAIVLVTKGTKDEAYLWLSRNKEKKMIEHLKSMQESGVPRRSGEKKKKGQTTIGDFS